MHDRAFSPLVTTCFGPPHGRRRVHREDLADNEPVAEHADGGQAAAGKPLRPVNRRDEPNAAAGAGRRCFGTPARSNT